MRQILPAFCAAFFLLTDTSFAQGIYTVNNTPGAAATYHTLQGALDSAAAGSTLLLQPSGQNYGFGNITKPVVIYGPGYALGQNNAPNTQAILLEAQLEQLTFSAGSQGSIVSGLSFAQSNLSNGTGLRIQFNSTSNVTVSRCKIRGTGCGSQGCRAHTFVTNTASNITISQCYIPTEGFLIGGSSSDITFKNNIINGLPRLNFVGYATNINCTFQNNSFYGQISEVSFANCSFYNNVIISPSPSDVVYNDAAMSAASHNVSNVNIFPAGGTNISNADGPNTYLLYSDPSVSSDDGIFQLKPGSVAIGYGNDGKDAGAFGGAHGFVLSGIPAIPNIYFADPQQTGTTTGGLKIHLKIKANN